jgi:hypothetical protein
MKSIASILATATVALPLSVAPISNAAADYCMNNVAGARLCIFATYGTRDNRGMIITVNGKHSKTEGIDCYRDNYGPTSIIAYGCWGYEGIKSDSTNFDKYPQASESLKGIMSGSGFLSNENAIDIDKARKAMPAEMK